MVGQPGGLAALHQADLVQLPLHHRVGAIVDFDEDLSKRGQCINLVLYHAQTWDFISQLQTPIIVLGEGEGESFVLFNVFYEIIVFLNINVRRMFHQCTFRYEF